MEFLQQHSLMRDYKAFNVSQLMRCNAAITSQAYRLKPKFTFTIGRSDVDVRRLIPLIGIDNESGKHRSEALLACHHSILLCTMANANVDTLARLHGRPGRQGMFARRFSLPSNSPTQVDGVGSQVTDAVPGT
jgi:hypothetical protein